ncbi:MAG: phosphotransferase [Bacteroidota bacterium]
MLELQQEILRASGASSIVGSQPVQTLWSGYGEIKRYTLEGGKYPSVIVKHIQPPEANNHPRGWNTELSNQRKFQSYQVEQHWYQHFAHQTDKQCKTPQCYHTFEKDQEILLIMEDLDASGYNIRLHPDAVNLTDVKNCLSWLAHFHAQFMGQSPEDLWPIGTYWHLDTRPDEWERMTNIDLKNAAAAIDEHLNKARFQTLVHGDAKLANFCFSESGEVAAVDFQYVGGGCGMKDVAYCISSCFEETDCEKYEGELLEHYFDQLDQALGKNVDFQLVKEEWRALYKYAWADFYRFLDGWSPGHWKMHGYSKRLTQQVLEELQV